MDTLPTAEEARNMIPAKAHTKTYNKFLEELECNIQRGRTSFNFYPASDDDFAEWESDKIRDSGYDLFWNRACTWYEVMF